MPTKKIKKTTRAVGKSSVQKGKKGRISSRNLPQEKEPQIPIVKVNLAHLPKGVADFDIESDRRILDRWIDGGALQPGEVKKKLARLSDCSKLAKVIHIEQD